MAKNNKTKVLVKVNDKYCLIVEATAKQVAEGYVEVLLADVFPKKAKAGVDEYIRLKIYEPEVLPTTKTRHWIVRAVIGYLKYSLIGGLITLLNFGTLVVAYHYFAK